MYANGKAVVCYQVLIVLVDPLFIVFISETSVYDDKFDFQEPKLQIEGCTFVIKNFPTTAGETATYITGSLIH